jgi:alanine racemase
MVDNFDYAQTLNNVGKKYSYQFRVHLKIDTGLSRLGILSDEAYAFVLQLKKLSYIKIEGIFSHFVASDNNPVVTSHQLDEFRGVLQQLSFLPFEHIHMSNTHAITTLNYTKNFNFFRVGLGIYGFGKPCEPLLPALTWKTHIVLIKTVPAHSYVSYACTYKTTRATKIAILPIGYFDGYQLRFSNKTCVLINNQIAPIIGRIAMNMTIIDITDCIAAVGDCVVLIGASSPVRLTNLAATAEIYNVRELLVGLNPAITRVII